MDEVNQTRMNVIGRFNFGVPSESETSLIFTCSARPGRTATLRL